MSEYHAYHVNPTWQGMPCKSVPGFVPATNDVFCKLFRELYTLFPVPIKRGTLRFESVNEPHLVKYNGEAKGAPLHIDTDH